MNLFQDKKWLLPVILGFLALSIVLVILVAPKNEKFSEENIPSQAYDEDIWGTLPEEAPGVAVETRYLNFYYPEELQDLVEVRLQEDETSSTSSFFMEISGSSVELFSVIFSKKDEQAYLLGFLTMENGSNVNVFIRMNELQAEDWSEEDYNLLCASQERVNDIIAQIYENEAFVSHR